MELTAVCATGDPGGAEIGLLRLLDRLARDGWRPTLTSPRPGSLRGEALRRGWRWRAIDVGGLRAGPAGRVRAAASGPRARRATGRADVVYLNGTVCGRLLPALVGRHTVLHVHDMVSRVPRTWARANVVLADSQAVADALAPLAAHVVHCPVEMEPAEVSPPWVEDGRPVVGFVGRIEPRKGPLELVRAAPAIRAGMPAARIVIVGSDPYGGDPTYLETVRADTGVEHHEWVAGAAGLMGHLDVLVAPSRQEPFGTVLAEAMAAGTPVVATSVDGIPEAVRDGVDGVLVDPEASPRQLADAVLTVLARREEMGAAARESARRFDADAYAARVAALIDPRADGVPAALDAAS